MLDGLALAMVRMRKNSVQDVTDFHTEVEPGADWRSELRSSDSGKTQLRKSAGEVQNCLLQYRQEFVDELSQLEDERGATSST